MTAMSLASPRGTDPACVKQARERLGHAIGTLADRTLARAVEAAASDPKLAPVFVGILAGSPFLAECVQREPDLVARFHTEGPDALASDLTAELAAVDRNDRTRLMSSLRRCRRRHALVIALADLTGAWPLEGVTAASRASPTAPWRWRSITFCSRPCAAASWRRPTPGSRRRTAA